MLPVKQQKKKIESRREWRQIFLWKKRVEEEVRKRCEKWAPIKAVKDKPLQSVWKKKLLRDRKILAIEAEITHSVQRQNQLEQVNNKFLEVKNNWIGRTFYTVG